MTRAPSPSPARAPWHDRVGAPLAAVGVLVAVSGAALLVPYAGGLADPYAATHALASGGAALARAAHAWASTLLLVLAFLALALAWLRGAAPRWERLACLGACALLLASAFAAETLPGDHRAARAWTHARDGAGVLGVPLPEAAPVTLLLVAHVAAPLAAAALLAPSLARAWPAWRAKPLPRVAPAAACLVLVAVLSLAFPPELGPRPVEGLEGARPAWPFLWLVPLQDWWGPVGLLALPVLVAALAAVVAARPPSTEPRRVAAVSLVVAALVVLSFLGVTGA